MATDTKMLGMTIEKRNDRKKRKTVSITETIIKKQKQRMATDTKIFGMRATKLRFCTFAK